MHNATLSTLRSPIHGLAMAAASLALLLGGCGKDDGPDDDSGTSTTTTTEEAAVVQISGGHSVPVGEGLTLTATTTGATDASYAWSSGDASIASVDAATGVVTGVAVGETWIDVEGADSGATASHVVVVTEVGGDGDVVVTLEGLPVVPVGETVPLTATTWNATDAGYTWTSSDEVVATVDSSGLVLGASVGEATITATGDDSGVSAELQLVVIQPAPHYDDWVASGHADITAQAFTHWNTQTPAEIPESCAGCHSTPGFLDRLGADGSAADVVDTAHPVGSVITCDACHDPTTEALDHVIFPSGEMLTDLGPEARCMTCHQGRASGDDVDATIAAAGVGDDATNASLTFDQMHYYAAGATVNASSVRGGYEYAGQVYDARLRHVEGFDTCTECHDPHSLEVRVSECTTCHTGVTSVSDLRDVRMKAAEARDYDGDGDLSEGVYYEVDGLRTLLLGALQTYATEQGLTAICYGAGTYPYWFQDTDGSGDCSAAEAVYANQYASWTPRMLRSAYNYSVSTHDPGSWVHNRRYTVQLLHDAIEDLNQALTATVDLSSADRGDLGHFDGAGDVAAHWATGPTPTDACSTCHGGAEGMRFFLDYGVGIATQDRDRGLDCETCHADPGTSSALLTIDEVVFPSGDIHRDPGSASNLCMSCHQGRSSGADIDAAIAAGRFELADAHDMPAAAVKLGTEVQAGYQYLGKTYSGDWTMHGQCTSCHDATADGHTFHPTANPQCTGGCHSPTPVRAIRGVGHQSDYDGDGDANEPLQDELTGFATVLLAEMQSAAQANASPLCFDGAVAPGFFNDTNANGICEAAETTAFNRFTAWTPGLLKAAHNYRLYRSDRGAWAHNFDYIAQLMYDSAEDLGGPGPVAGLIRPIAN